MKKILIVEDDKVTQTLYVKCLKDQYSIVDIAMDGNDAIKKANMYNPDLILMDIQLKGEMDGIDAAKMILKEHHIPLLFISSLNDTATLERAKLSNPFGYFLKPIEVDVLKTNIIIALNAYSSIKKFSDNKFAESVKHEKHHIDEIALQLETSIQKDTNEDVKIIIENNQKKIEIVNNRFMKQYWILDD